MPIAGIEKLIGGRWYAFLGAVTVVIGVAMFFRLALQQGWFVLTPTAKCIGGGAFGALLLIAGEGARRRISANAAAGLSAAGIGVVYASVYAAYGLYHIVGQVPAFVMLVGVAALGIFVGARARLVSVAIVSLLCGYLTPILLANEQPRPLVIPLYLITLLVVGLVLSGWRGGRFFAVRTLVWWGTMIMGAVWSLNHGNNEPGIAVAFLAICWTAIHGEIAISSGRFGLPRRADAEHEIEVSDGAPNRFGQLPLGPWLPLSSSFSTTAWAALLGTLLLRNWGAAPSWLMTAGLAVASGMAALVLAGHLRILKEKPGTDPERLGACLLVQAGALIIAASALALDGPAQTVFWLAMGVAVVVGGRWISSRALDVYGIIVLTLATGRTLVWESWAGPLTLNGSEAFGLYLTLWTALTAAVAGAWIVVSYLFRRDSADRPMLRFVSDAAAAIGLTLLCVSLQSAKGSVLVPPVSAATLGLAACALGHVLSSKWLKGYALLVLGLTSAFVLIQCWWMASVSGPGVSWLGLRITGWSLAVLYLAVVWITAATLLRRREGVFGVFAKLCAGMGVAFAMGSLLHQQASGRSVVIASMIIAMGAGSARLRVPNLVLDKWGVLGLLATALAWVVAFPFWGEGWQASTAAPGLHGGLWTGLALAAGFGLFARWLLVQSSTARIPGWVEAAYTSMGLMAFASTTLEVSRAAVLIAHDPTVERAAVSVWWGLFAFGLIALGFVLPGQTRGGTPQPRGVPICRQAGLALLGIAALKSLIVDLGDVDPLGRVISIVGVGLLMLCVSVTYAKVSARLAKNEPAAELEG